MAQLEVGPHESRGYSRDETKADQLDRNLSELVQELRVIGTGVQVLFAFLLSIAFQARFTSTSGFQRDIYLVTLMLSGVSVATLIAPVAVHRFLFRFRMKDEVVAVTNGLAIAGMAVLSVAMTAAVLLVSDWVAGTVGAVICTTLAAAIFGAGWFAFPWWLRRRADEGDTPLDHDGRLDRPSPDRTGRPKQGMTPR